MIVFGQDPFWKDHPSDDEKFDALVLEGIYIYPPPMEGIGIQSEYKGVSASKLARCYSEWKSDREGFLRDRPVHVVKAMLAFEQDYEQLDVRDVIRYASFPTAPEGYFWVRHQGGLQWRAVYRLWNDKLGYVPSSE